MLLLHGLLDSSDTWVLNGRNSLAFILHDQGYDVWMANFRCTPYSEKHKTLDSKIDVEYWRNCTVHEMAEYDLPSFIGHVKRETGLMKISIVAHS